MNQFLADLHVHSRASSSVFSQSRLASIVAAHDCYTKEEDILRVAKEKKLSAVAIADHNRIEISLRMSNKYPEFFIPSCEYDIYVPKCEEFNYILDGKYANGQSNIVHILAYGIKEELLHKEFLKNSSNIESFSRLAKDSGTVLALPHSSYLEWPISYIKSIINSTDLNDEKAIIKPRFYDFLLSHLDLIETIDGNQLYNDFSKLLATHYEFPQIGGSDSHSLSTIGSAYTLFENVSDARECVEILRSGKGFRPEGNSATLENLCDSMNEAVNDFVEFENEERKVQGLLNYIRRDPIKYLTVYWIIKPFHKLIIKSGMKSYSETMRKLQGHLINDFVKSHTLHN